MSDAHRPDGPADPTHIEAGGDVVDDDDFDVDESAYELDGGGRFLSGWRLAGAGIAVVALLGAGAAFVLAGGDGGGRGEGDESVAGDDGRSDVDFADAALEYAQCMRDEGLEDWPDPVIADGGVVDLDSGETYDMDMPEVQAAHEECQSIVDAAQDQPPQLTPEEQAEMQDQALAMVECMRDRGWEMPDPEISEDGGSVGIAVEEGESNLPLPGDPDLERFEQDQEECDEEAGFPGPDEGGGGGGAEGGGS